MKLRNKKTGETIEICKVNPEPFEARDFECNSLAELNVEWEDVPEPKEYRMRELKFRAWDTKNEVWTFATLGDLVCGACKPDGDKPLSGAKQIWEQYTELKDKNGKEIYEGDIVDKAYYNLDTYNKICVVNMGELYDSDGLNNGEILGWRAGDSSLLDVCEDCAVIGNIHENPELLGGEE